MHTFKLFPVGFVTDFMHDEQPKLTIVLLGYAYTDFLYLTTHINLYLVVTTSYTGMPSCCVLCTYVNSTLSSNNTGIAPGMWDLCLPYLATIVCCM